MREREHLNDNSFYDILGYDILIIDDFIPKLIEINFALCMLISNELEKIIKTYLFVDTLNLIGIIPYYRKTEEPLNSRYKFKNETDEYINMALCELERPRGDYELIFTTRKNIQKYKKFFGNTFEENKKGIFNY